MAVKYQLKEGEDLYTICEKNKITLDKLVEINQEADLYSLLPGQSVFIPEQQDRLEQQQMPKKTIDGKIKYDQGRKRTVPVLVHYVVREAETLEKVLERFDTNLQELLEYNGLNTITLKKGSVLTIPVYPEGEM